MKTNVKKFKYILLIAVLLLFLFTLNKYVTDDVKDFSAIDKNFPTSLEDKEKIPLSLKQEATDTINIVIKTDTTVSFAVPAHSTLYEALQEAQKNKLLFLEGKTYPNLGFFVTKIGALKPGGGKELIYYINGKEATVGVSSYELNDNDVIEWKLE